MGPGVICVWEERVAIPCAGSMCAGEMCGGEMWWDEGTVMSGAVPGGGAVVEEGGSEK